MLNLQKARKKLAKIAQRLRARARDFCGVPFDPVQRLGVQS
jgi:hypothetical protein